MAMKHESLLRSVASGLLIALGSKILAVVTSTKETIDKLSYDVPALKLQMDREFPALNLRLDRQRDRILEIDTRVRLVEIKQGDPSHGRN